MNLNDIGNFRIILPVVCLVLLSPGCQRDTEQTKVRKIITDVQRAAEEKDIRTILGHLSRTYRDPQGYDYNGILNFCNNALKWYWFYEIIASRYGSFPGVAGQIR